MLPKLRNLWEQARQRYQPQRPAEAWFLSSFINEDKLSVDETTITEFARAVELQEKRQPA